METVKLLMTSYAFLTAPRSFSGGWCSPVVLAAKPHQEECNDILDFIWRFCVSYRGLYAVTAPLEWPIPRCDEALDNFITDSNRIYFHSLDAKSGYMQVQVRLEDQEKLAFFLPNDTKETFTVMPFGPARAPVCYTLLMWILHRQWERLFAERFPELASSFTIAAKLVQHGDRQIVDDILRFSKFFSYFSIAFAKSLSTLASHSTQRNANFSLKELNRSDLICAATETVLHLQNFVASSKAGPYQQLLPPSTPSLVSPLSTTTLSSGSKFVSNVFGN